MGDAWCAKCCEDRRKTAPKTRTLMAGKKFTIYRTTFKRDDIRHIADYLPDRRGTR